MENSIFEKFENILHSKFEFNIKFKNESLLMKLIGLLLFFNKSFMTNFITPIGNTIYFPNKNFIINNDFVSCEVLAHELVHVSQMNKFGKFLFILLYLFPQCLVILALLSPISHWFLLFLLFILPIPAPFRAMLEFEAYTMSIYMKYLDVKYVRKMSPDNIHSELEIYANNINKRFFIGSAYFFMWPFGINLSKKMKDIESDVISDTHEIYDFMKESYLTAVSSYELQI